MNRFIHLKNAVITYITYFGLLWP